MIITLSFFSTILDIIIFLLVLGLVICLHELGHLFFAKKAGILCHEFSFGMGPKLWSKKKGETFYSIRAIPFGGYVSMSGEEIEADIVKIGDEVRLGFDEFARVNRIIIAPDSAKFADLKLVKVETVDLTTDGKLFINEYPVNDGAFYVDDKKQVQIAPKSRRFDSKTIPQRFLTTFGGPLMNFILALVVFLIVAFSIGVPDGKSTIVSDVNELAPAGEVLEAGDRIVSINGVEVNTWTGDVNSVSSELDKTISGYEIVVERNGELITLAEIHPLLVFYGLRFTAEASTSELIIDQSLEFLSDNYLLAGDELISIDGVGFSTWDDVKEFQQNNLAGSKDKEDLYEFTVNRQVKADFSGTITAIEETGGNHLITVKNNSDDSLKTYSIDSRTSLSVAINDSVESGDVLAEGLLTFEQLIYGEKILKTLGADIYLQQIGINGSSKFSFFGAIGNGFVLLWDAATSIFSTLGLLFGSDLVGISDLSGFVGIFTLTSSAAAQGFLSLLSFIGLLSVNLGILNLLPIPALDGGRIVFLGYEAITKKKPNQRIENWLHTIVFFLLMALMIYVTYYDILRLIGIN
ncbi:MAG: site-2 protease family protein [Candidatus Izemoplasmatales bacterium]